MWTQADERAGLVAKLRAAARPDAPEADDLGGPG